MLVKFKTLISERISKVVFIPLLFFLILISFENFFALFITLNFLFFYLWFATGNLGKSVFFAFFFFSLWYLLTPLVSLKNFFWAFIFIVLLLLFIEKQNLYFLLKILFIFSPLIFYQYLTFSFVLTLFSILGLNFIFEIFFNNLKNAVFSTILLFQLLILAFLLPFDGLWRFILLGSLPSFLKFWS